MFPLRKPLACLLIAAAAMSARSALAEDKPEVFFRAATLLERVKQLADTGGFTVPPVEPMTNHLERSYSFLGEGSVVHNRPIGVAGYLVKTTPDASLRGILSECTAFIIPVNAGSASFDALQQYGTTADPKAVTNEKDKTVIGKDIALKRTADYVAFSEGAAAAYVENNPFADDFKKPNVLGVASLNLGLMRKKAPEIEEKLIDLIKKEASRQDGPIVDIAVSIWRPIIDSIDTVNVVATHADDVLTYTAAVDPAAVKAPAAFDRPVFVEGQFIELHVVWPSEKFAKWAPSIIEKTDITKLPFILEDVETAKQLAARAAKLFLGDGAFSAGILIGKDGLPVVHTVTQFASDVDAAKEVNEIAASIKAVAKKNKIPTPIDVSEYTAGKQKVIRVTILNNDVPEFYVDLAQSGRKLAATFSIEKFEGKAATLLAMPAKEKNSNFVFAAIDIVPMLEMSMGRFLNKPGVFAKMKTGIGDARYTVSAKSDDAGKSMIVEVKQPLIIAREMEKAMKEMWGGDFHGEPGGVEIVPEPMVPLDIQH